MTANRKHTDEHLRQDTAIALGAAHPGKLLQAFDEAMTAVLEQNPVAERWACACGSAYRLPSGLSAETRRTLWLTATRSHSSESCSLSVVGPDDLEKTRKQLADLRQRIAKAISFCEEPDGLRYTVYDLAHEVVQILSTPTKAPEGKP